VVAKSDELKEALYRAAVAEKIADKAIEMALRALSKVEAMEKSTHKAYFVNPQQGVEEQVLSGEGQAPPTEVDKELDKLFDAARSKLDDSIDVFSEGD
jgi:hypothetical protein